MSRLAQDHRLHPRPSWCPLEHISQVLNHSNSEITRVYARLHKDNQRAALVVSSEVLDQVFGAIEVG